MLGVSNIPHTSMLGVSPGLADLFPGPMLWERTATILTIWILGGYRTLLPGIDNGSMGRIRSRRVRGYHLSDNFKKNPAYPCFIQPSTKP